MAFTTKKHIGYLKIFFYFYFPKHKDTWSQKCQIVHSSIVSTGCSSFVYQGTNLTESLLNVSLKLLRFQMLFRLSGIPNFVLAKSPLQVTKPVINSTSTSNQKPRLNVAANPVLLYELLADRGRRKNYETELLDKLWLELPITERRHSAYYFLSDGSFVLMSVSANVY